jgi:hypothetical protein
LPFEAVTGAVTRMSPADGTFSLTCSAMRCPSTGRSWVAALRAPAPAAGALVEGAAGAATREALSGWLACAAGDVDDAAVAGDVDAELAALFTAAPAAPAALAAAPLVVPVAVGDGPGVFCCAAGAWPWVAGAEVAVVAAAAPAGC